MPVRLKKFIGTVLLVALVVIYALVASAIAVGRLSTAGTAVELAFFILSGLAWILPAMWIIRWMVREPRRR
jgi:hypothetical protein